jgi:hypothetical protein
VIYTMIYTMIYPAIYTARSSGIGGGIGDGPSAISDITLITVSLSSTTAIALTVITTKKANRA